jgi:ubiquinone/menaquinone biosynthesis C-methylase UbiE
MRVASYFDQVAKEYDNLAWDQDTAPWAKWAWQIIRSEVGCASGLFIVDLGAGTGRTILNLIRFNPKARFLGVDFSEEMIRQARQKDYLPASVDFQLSRIDELRLSPESVDVFTTFGTFHHIKNKRRVLENLATMLKPGGKFVNADLFEPCEQYLSEMHELRRQAPEATTENDRVRESFQWVYDRDRSHPREFHTDPYEFKSLLEEFGFHPTTVHVSLQPGFAVVAGQKSAEER